MTDWKILLVFCMIVSVLASIWFAWLTAALWEIQSKTKSHERDIKENSKNINDNKENIKANKRRANALAYHLGVSFYRDEGDRYFCKEDQEDA